MREMRRLPTDTPVFVEPRIKTKADGSADLAMTEEGFVDITKLPEGLAIEVLEFGIENEEGDVTEEEIEQRGCWIDGIKTPYVTPGNLELDANEANKEYPISPELSKSIMGFRVLIKKLTANDFDKDIETFREEFCSYRDLLGDKIFSNILESSKVYKNFERLETLLSEKQENPS